MSKQKIMYIIATVLLTGVSAQSVFAESLVDLSGVVTTETEGAVRNETFGVDAATSLQQNTEIKVGDSSKDDEKILQGIQTGSALSATVDALIAGTSEVDADNEDYCKVLDATLMKQSDSARAGLAWNATSYEKNINLKFQGSTDSQASLHESSQDAYKAVSAELKNIKPKSSASIDQVMLSRFQAITRSVLVEMNMNLKAKTLDSERTENLSKLLNGSLKCVDKYSSQDESNSAALLSVKESIGGVVTSWNANKDSFGVQADVVKEPFYLKVTSKDAIFEESKVPVSADKVMTKEDLSLYVRSTIKNDPALKDVTIEDSSVSVKYATRGKLFGFIPVWLSPETTVDTIGNVSVSYPWYAGLSTKKVKIKAEAVKEDLATLGLVAEESKDVAPAVEMSMQYRARLIESLDLVLKSETTATAKVSEEKEIDTKESVDVETDVKGEGDIEVVPQA